MAVFFEGRRAQNSEDNIELGDGGGHDLYGVVLHGMAVFFEEPGMYILVSLYIYIYTTGDGDILRNRIPGCTRKTCSVDQVELWLIPRLVSGLVHPNYKWMNTLQKSHL